MGRLQQPALSKTPRALATTLRPATPATPQWRLGASPCHGGCPPPSQRRVPGTPRNPGCHAPRPGAPAGAAPGDARDPESLALPCAPAGRLGIGRHGARATGLPMAGMAPGMWEWCFWGQTLGRRRAGRPLLPIFARRLRQAGRGSRPGDGRLLRPWGGSWAPAPWPAAPCAPKIAYICGLDAAAAVQAGPHLGLVRQDRLYLAAWNGRDAGIWIPESCI